MTSPYLIVLDAADRHRLTRWVWAGSTPQKLVLRALIVLLAADGASNAAIADELGICVDTARKWRAPVPRHRHRRLGRRTTFGSPTDLHPGRSGHGDRLGVPVTG